MGELAKIENMKGFFFFFLHGISRLPFFRSISRHPGKEQQQKHEAESECLARSIASCVGVSCLLWDSSLLSSLLLSGLSSVLKTLRSYSRSSRTHTLIDQSNHNHHTESLFQLTKWHADEKK